MFQKNILYSWIPSHVGIKGNEVANAAAKQASSSSSSSAPITDLGPIFYKDLQKYLIKATAESWNEEWINSRPTSLHKIRKNRSDISPAMSLNRKVPVIVTRVRIGHTNWTYSYLIIETDANICDSCDVQNSISHILTTCPVFSREKAQHNLQNSLNMLQKGTHVRKF